MTANYTILLLRVAAPPPSSGIHAVPPFTSPGPFHCRRRRGFTLRLAGPFHCHRRRGFTLHLARPISLPSSLGVHAPPRRPILLPSSLGVHAPPHSTAVIVIGFGRRRSGAALLFSNVHRALYLSKLTQYTRIDPSSERETMCWPSGENATDQTEPVCPVKGPAAVSPVTAFQTQIDPS